MVSYCVLEPQRQIDSSHHPACHAHLENILAVMNEPFFAENVYVMFVCQQNLNTVKHFYFAGFNFCGLIRKIKARKDIMLHGKVMRGDSTLKVIHDL